MSKCPSTSSVGLPLTHSSSVRVRVLTLTDSRQRPSPSRAPQRAKPQHASTIPRYAQTPLVEGSYNFLSPFDKTFNHITFDGLYQSSVINIFSYGFYYKCICKLDRCDDIRKYLMLTIIYDFMAFVSRYYRFRLIDREPSEYRVSVFRTELLICMDDYKTDINIDPVDVQHPHGHLQSHH